MNRIAYENTRLHAARWSAAASHAGNLMSRTNVRATQRLLGLIAPYRWRAALALAITAVGCLLNFPVPLLIQGLVDGAVGSGGFSPALAVALLGVFAAQAGSSLAVAHVAGPVGLGVVRDLRHSLYARLQRLGLPFYDRMPAGAIISRLMDDVAAVQALVTSQALAILADLGTVLAILALVLSRDLGVAAVALAVMAGYAGLFAAFGGRVRDGSTEVRERLDRIFGHLKERLDAAVVVRACDGEDTEIAAFARTIDDAHGPRVRVGGLGAALVEPERRPERHRHDLGVRCRGLRRPYPAG